MPTFDTKVIGHLNEQFKSGILVLIADNHKDSLARLAVKSILSECEVKALFLELPVDCKAANGTFGNVMRGKYGLTLSDAEKKMRKDGISIKDAMSAFDKGGYFTTPNPFNNGRRVSVGLDASPNLVELSAVAVSRNVQVVPCDTGPSKLVAQLQARRGESAETVSFSTLFSDEGIGYRDQLTAERVANFVHKNGPKGLLMLWGANHVIDASADSGRAGLKPLLEGHNIRVSRTVNPTVFFSSL